MRARPPIMPAPGRPAYASEEERQEARRETQRRWDERHRESERIRKRLAARKNRRDPAHRAKEAAAARARYAANRDELRERHAGYMRIARAKWTQEQLEAKRRKDREYAAVNAERAQAKVRAWALANPTRAKANGKQADLRRRARKAAALLVPFSKATLAQRFVMFDGCWICGESWSQVDHVKPLSRGGAHTLANLRPICAPCNRRKGSRWPFPTSRQAAFVAPYKCSEES